MATAIGGVAAGPADAAVYTATLTSFWSIATTARRAAPSQHHVVHGYLGPYDDVTGLLTQTLAAQQRVTTAPTSTLYRVFITGLVMGNGAAASAATYTCTEGNFGGNVGASICGNYTFGANFFSESTTSWGPGTAVLPHRSVATTKLASSRLACPGATPESIAVYDNMTTASFDARAGTLVLRNGDLQLHHLQRHHVVQQWPAVDLRQRAAAR